MNAEKEEQRRFQTVSQHFDNVRSPLIHMPTEITMTNVLSELTMAVNRLIGIQEVNSKQQSLILKELYKQTHLLKKMSKSSTSDPIENADDSVSRFYVFRLFMFYYVKFVEFYWPQWRTIFNSCNTTNAC